MAKSLFEIQETGVAEVTHNGAECNVTLPEWWTSLAMACLAKDGDIDAYWERLLDSDRQALLQAAAAKLLIEIRAAARPADFPASEGGAKRELMSPDRDGRLPQDRVDAYELTPLKRPGSGGGNKVAKAKRDTWAATAQALHATDMAEDTIEEILTASGCPSPRARELAEG